MPGIITADSMPDYDGWGWDPYWSCQDWITWHRALVERHGLQTANQIATAAWQKQDAFEHARNWCKYNQAFVSYFKSVGLGDDQSLLSQAVEAGHNLLSSGVNITQGIENAAVMLKRIVPVMILLALVIATVYFWKKSTA